MMSPYSELFQISKVLQEVEGASFWKSIEGVYDDTWEEKLDNLFHLWEGVLKQAPELPSKTPDELLTIFQIMVESMLQRLIRLSRSTNSPDHIFQVISKLIKRDIKPLLKHVLGLQEQHAEDYQKKFNHWILDQLLESCFQLDSPIEIHDIIIQNVEQQGEIFFLIHSLEGADPKKAYQCYVILYRLRHGDFLNYVDVFKDHPSSEVRNWVVDILKQYPNPEARTGLCSFLQDQDREIICQLLEEPDKLAHRGNFDAILLFMQAKGKDLGPEQVKGLYQTLLLSDPEKMQNLVLEIFHKRLFWMSPEAKEAINEIKDLFIEALMERSTKTSHDVLLDVKTNSEYDLSDKQREKLRKWFGDIEPEQLREPESPGDEEEEDEEAYLAKYLSGVQTQSFGEEDLEFIRSANYTKEDFEKEEANFSADPEPEPEPEPGNSTGEKVDYPQPKRDQYKSNEPDGERDKNESNPPIPEPIPPSSPPKKPLPPKAEKNFDSELEGVSKSDFFVSFLEETYSSEIGKLLNILQDFFVIPFTEGDPVDQQRDEILLFLCSKADDKNILIFLDFLHTQEQFKLNDRQKMTVAFLLRKEGLM